MYLLALCTGMRIGEILALCWDSVDFSRNMIYVRHTLDYTKEKGLFLETPKTLSSVRGIPMLEEIALPLRQRYEASRAASSGSGAPADPPDSESEPADSGQGSPYSGFVFLSSSGKPVYPSVVQSELNRIIGQMNANGIECPHFSLHTLRHTFATRCIESDMNYKTLQTILGHSTLQTTMNVYAHCLPETMRAEMEKAIQLPEL